MVLDTILGRIPFLPPPHQDPATATAGRRHRRTVVVQTELSSAPSVLYRECWPGPR